MKKLLLFTLLLSCSMSWSQQSFAIDKETSAFLTTLENRGVTSYFTTDRYCDSQNVRIEPKKKCNVKASYLARYVFWKENNVTKMKLIDNCGAFSNYSLKDDELSAYFTANIEEIKTNEIKVYEKANNEIPIRRVGPNNCKRVFMFKTASGAFVKRYNMFDLSSDLLQKNIHKVTNNSQPIVMLDKMIDETTLKMESNISWSRM